MEPVDRLKDYPVAWASKRLGWEYSSDFLKGFIRGVDEAGNDEPLRRLVRLRECVWDQIGGLHGQNDF